MTTPGKPLEVLVITGGHRYEKAEFFAAFDAVDGIAWTHAEQPEARAWLHPRHKGRWDAVVFYDVEGLEIQVPSIPKLLDPPSDYVQGMKELLAEGQGTVLLHHAIASWPRWPWFARMAGGRWNYVAGELEGRQWPSSGYTAETTHRVSCLAPNHPVCAGVEDGFEIADELFLFPVLEEGLTPLLRTDYPQTADGFYAAELAMMGREYDNEGWDHPEGSGLIGWAKPADNSPLVYLQCGHGPAAYANPSFRTLLGNSIRWVASEEAHDWARQQESVLDA